MRIGIIGDFHPEYHTHAGIQSALEHTAEYLGEPVRGEWLPTPEMMKPGAEKILAGFDGLWAAPASPYESGEGMLRAMEYARSRNVPFTGT